MIAFPGVDEKQTIKNVIKYLKRHKIRVLRAGAEFNYQSPVLDGMPHQRSYGNVVENRMIEQAQAQQKIKATFEALELLDENSKIIIKRLYIDKEPKYNWQIAQEIGYSDTQFKVIKHNSYLFFAEAYHLSDLRVLKNKISERQLD